MKAGLTMILGFEDTSSEDLSLVTIYGSTFSTNLVDSNDNTVRCDIGDDTGNFKITCLDLA